MNKENRGALFKNKDKKSENHPLYKGSINIEGVEYWISSWIQQSKAGEKYMSLSVNRKEQKNEESDEFVDMDVGY